MAAMDSRAEKQVLRMERKMSKMDPMRFSREEVMDDIFERGFFEGGLGAGGGGGVERGGGLVKGIFL